MEHVNKESKGVPTTRARFMCFKCGKESTNNKGSKRVSGMFVCATCAQPKTVHLPPDDSEGGNI